MCSIRSVSRNTRSRPSAPLRKQDFVVFNHQSPSLRSADHSTRSRENGRPSHGHAAQRHAPRPRVDVTRTGLTDGVHRLAPSPATSSSAHVDVIAVEHRHEQLLATAKIQRKVFEALRCVDDDACDFSRHGGWSPPNVVEKTYEVLRTSGGV